MRRRALAAAAVVLVAALAALAAVAPASASRFIRSGIFDDGMVLYENPETTFPLLKSANTETVRVNLWWGGRPSPSPTASRPAAPTRTIRPTAGTRTTGSCSGRGSPTSASSSRSRGPRTGPTAARAGTSRRPGRRPAGLRDRRGRPLQRHLQARGRDAAPEGAVLARLERAQQPDLPEAAVRAAKAAGG